MIKNFLKLIKICSVGILLVLLYFSFRSFLKFPTLPREKRNADSPTQFGTLIDQIRPILAELTQQTFFQYFRVDVSKNCPFWGNEAKCTKPAFCKLNCECPVKKLPSTWVAEDLKIRENEGFSKIEFSDMMKPIKQKKDKWSFDEITDHSIYVDLLNDKEQYTGYQGQKIWNSLYEDHCMKLVNTCGSGDFLYKMISGMHTSVSTHLTEYFVEFGKFNRSQIVYANDQMYFEKVGDYPDRIESLIFAVQILLRSFVRYVDLIRDFNIDTGEFNNDMKTKQLLHKLVNLVGNQKDKSFDDKLIFGEGNNVEQRRDAYLTYFTNMTKVMDCVDCMKCKAYGKMQILGLSVALRILLKKSDTFLSRNELVAFVNTLSKWTESVHIIDRMRQRMLNRLISKAIYWVVLTVAVFLGADLLARKYALNRLKFKTI